MFLAKVPCGLSFTLIFFLKVRKFPHPPHIDSMFPQFHMFVLCFASDIVTLRHALTSQSWARDSTDLLWLKQQKKPCFLECLGFLSISVPAPETGLSTELSTFSILVVYIFCLFALHFLQSCESQTLLTHQTSVQCLRKALVNNFVPLENIHFLQAHMC